MQVSLWVWLVSVAGVVALIAFDFFTHVRRPHAPSMREAAIWSVFYVALAIVFGFGMMALWDKPHALAFFAGYVTEKSLSVDNLFVFLILMSSFKVPRIHQQEVLLAGVVIALVLRAVFILLGAAMIEHFSWTFYLFGLFLLFTAAKLAFGKKEESEEYQPNPMVRWFQNHLRLAPDYDGAKLVTRINGRRHFTPMVMVMLAIGFTDILFALDSIPAIYGLTDVPYIVFATNAFALLGLIQLYFLIGGLLQKLVYLGIGLSLILAFIGAKLVLEALASNALPFINGGQPVTGLPHIDTGDSLTVIVVILAITTACSLWKSRRDAVA
ncbi:MAG: TerC/Alx family metal homeostasis membrane protein [Nevskiaceae bacterium]|nr:MAG: TerC/Alx family metal homeostasis membrane protein [Nevskiaceae bacterium]TBR74292.1 MAG: TerC/Alx family metal homeostasis membrane protein [Nevskiaceae bacterium]